jgi:hypothetical protein
VAARDHPLAVPVRYYAYPLDLPVVIMAAMNLGLAALGEQPELSVIPERIPAYLRTFLLTVAFFGGQEEHARAAGLSRVAHRGCDAG